MILGETKALCPECLAVLPARLRREGRGVFLERQCPEHGEVSALVWDGEPDFAAWRRDKAPPGRGSAQTVSERGCPRDCGRCPEHRQHPCTVLLEITRQCNLRCPVCFASAGGEGGDIPLAELRVRLEWIRREAGGVVLQLSGGEPTLRPDLVSLVRAAASLFPAVQLNTNGLKLARDEFLAPALAQAGLSWVFLQFDGTEDGVYRALRGRDLLAEKIRAVENCARAGLGLVLVPTLARGVNEHALGDILEFALARAPHVRGIHIQPMTRSGRNSLEAGLALTLPEVMRLLAAQSGGRILPEHAVPPGCEHERCSFHCRYVTDGRGGLRPLGGAACCAPGDVGADDPLCGAPGGVAAGGSSCCAPAAPLRAGPEDGAARAIDSVIRNWRGQEEALPGDDAFTLFINRARRTFSITCMAFQDAWTADLERLRGCCVHVYAEPGRLMPFCSYNLTDASGRALHRRGPGHGE